MVILRSDAVRLIFHTPEEIYNSEIPKEHPDYKRWLGKLPHELSKDISIMVMEKDVVDTLAQTKMLTIFIYSPLNLDSFAHEVGHALSNKFELKKLLANHPRAKNPLFNEIIADLVKSYLTRRGFMGESTKAELEKILGKEAYGSLR